MTRTAVIYFTLFINEIYRQQRFYRVPGPPSNGQAEAVRSLSRSSRCARTRTAAHLNGAIRSSSGPAERCARSNCTRVPGRSLVAREKYLRAGLTELTIARSLTIPRGPLLCFTPGGWSGYERRRRRPSSAGRNARRLPRGLRSPHSFSYTRAASVHLAWHSRPIEILSHSLATAALRGLPRALLYRKKTRRQEKQNEPATFGRVCSHGCPQPD